MSQDGDGTGSNRSPDVSRTHEGIRTDGGSSSEQGDAKEQRDKLSQAAQKLRQKEQRLDEREDSLEEKAKRLEDKENQLEEREQSLKQREQEIDQKEQEVLDRREQIVEEREQLDEREELLDEREGRLEERAGNLEDREQEVARRADEIETKEEALAEYASRDGEFSHRTHVVGGILLWLTGLASGGVGVAILSLQDALGGGLLGRPAAVYGLAALFIVVALVEFLGGYWSFRGRHWLFSIIASFIALVLFFPFGMAATVLIGVGESQFE